MTDTSVQMLSRLPARTDPCTPAGAELGPQQKRIVELEAQVGLVEGWSSITEETGLCSTCWLHAARALPRTARA